MNQFVGNDSKASIAKERRRVEDVAVKGEWCK